VQERLFYGVKYVSHLCSWFGEESGESIRTHDGASSLAKNQETVACTNSYSVEQPVHLFFSKHFALCLVFYSYLSVTNLFCGCGETFFC